jgi:hypothetical protein
VALDPELVERYAEAKRALDAARTGGTAADSPELLEAQEDCREALAAYLMDLQVNGFSVPADLQSELDDLDETGQDEPAQ